MSFRVTLLAAATLAAVAPAHADRADHEKEIFEGAD